MITQMSRVSRSRLAYVSVRRHPRSEKPPGDFTSCPPATSCRVGLSVASRRVERGGHICEHWHAGIVSRNDARAGTAEGELKRGVMTARRDVQAGLLPG